MQTAEFKARIMKGAGEQEVLSMLCPVCGKAPKLKPHPNEKQLVAISCPDNHFTCVCIVKARPDWWEKYTSNDDWVDFPLDKDYSHLNGKQES